MALASISATVFIWTPREYSLLSSINWSVGKPMLAALHATLWLGEAGQFAGTLCRPAGEEVVYLLEA